MAAGHAVAMATWQWRKNAQVHGASVLPGGQERASLVLLELTPFALGLLVARPTWPRALGRKST